MSQIADFPVPGAFVYGGLSHKPRFGAGAPNSGVGPRWIHSSGRGGESPEDQGPAGFTPAGAGENPPKTKAPLDSLQRARGRIPRRRRPRWIHSSGRGGESPEDEGRAGFTPAGAGENPPKTKAALDSLQRARGRIPRRRRPRWIHSSGRGGESPEDEGRAGFTPAGAGENPATA